MSHRVLIASGMFIVSSCAFAMNKDTATRIRMRQMNIKQCSSHKIEFWPSKYVVKELEKITRLPSNLSNEKLVKSVVLAKAKSPYTIQYIIDILNKYPTSTECIYNNAEQKLVIKCPLLNE
jgi:hypothetical protein